MHKLRENYVGRVEDTFVFTHNNDVITWSRKDHLQKLETGYEILADAELFSDGVATLGYTDSRNGHIEVSRVDINDGCDTIEYLFNGISGSSSGYTVFGHFDADTINVTMTTSTVFIDSDWSFFVG